MSSLLAVVGTDTNVGKTIVAAGLLTALRQAGQRVAGFKAVETGIDKLAKVQPDNPPDWRRLENASGQHPGSALGVSFPLPAAPLAAAREAHQVLSLEDLERKLHHLLANHDLVVLEGAGGLHVPCTEELLWIDILCRWQPTCLLVGRLGLGTINHSLLSIESLRHRGIEPLGLLLSALEEPGPEARYTPDILRTFTSITVFDPLPHGQVHPDKVATHLRHSGTLHSIFRSLHRSPHQHPGAA